MDEEEQPRGDITTLLREWRHGESAVPDRVPDRLLELAYPQLHRIAANLLRGERTDTILQPTSLVNELFFRMLRQRGVPFDDRQHFYRLAARLMRHIVIDQARGELRQKRDGRLRVPLSDDVLAEGGSVRQVVVDPVDLDRALGELENQDPEKLRMVELRFFLGFTAEETADILRISKAKVDRDVRFVRGWLKLRLN